MQYDNDKDGYSKIPCYPKLLFQKENALASFSVQRRVLVSQPMNVNVVITCRESDICFNKPSYFHLIIW
jgi:hypothetical protein